MNCSVRQTCLIEAGYHETIYFVAFCRESWLHKQQQRLRAKKEQQQYRNDDYYQTTTYNTVGAGRQGKYNASKRDGYTSDTGFAADEVDYRQTYARAPPASRATYNEPGRNYHTITTTTTKTINKERPFVAVKRAHDQSKRGYDVSLSEFGSERISFNDFIWTSPILMFHH